MQRRSWRERDEENRTKSQTKGICGKKPSFPKLWREVVFLLISLSRCRRRGEFCCGLWLKKQREMGALILQLRLFLLSLKIKSSSGVNEIKKIAPNRKQRGFVERGLPFLICGEKLFSSSFRNLVAAVAGRSEKQSMKLQ